MFLQSDNDIAVNGPLKRNSTKGAGWVEITLPLETVSEANGGKKVIRMVKGKKTAKAEHWTEKNRRHKRQKGSISLLLKPLRAHLSLPCHITFTRYAPRKLDRFDNLPMAFKWILDCCCEIITGDYRPGRADDTDEIEVTYKQIISEHYGVKIYIKMLTDL